MPTNTKKAIFVVENYDINNYNSNIIINLRGEYSYSKEGKEENVIKMELDTDTINYIAEHVYAKDGKLYDIDTQAIATELLVEQYDEINKEIKLNINREIVKRILTDVAGYIRSILENKYNIISTTKQDNNKQQNGTEVDNIDDITKQTLDEINSNKQQDLQKKDSSGDIKKLIDKVSNLNLRTKLGKEEFNEILNEVVTDPNLMYNLFIQEEKLKNDAKYLKEIGNILLEEEKLNKDILKQYKLVKKDYARSGYYIKLREEEYIDKGFSLNATDLPTNIDNIYSYGLYDGVLNKYIVTKEQLTNFPINNFVREIRYSKEPVRNSMSIWALKNVSDNTLETGKISDYYNNPQLYINTALNIKEQLKVIKKVNGVIENLIKFYLAHNIYNLKTKGEIQAMKITGYYSKLKETVDKKNWLDIGQKLASSIRIDKFNKDTYNPHEYTRLYLELELGNNKIYTSYKEVLDKDVILQDMRSKQSRMNLISFTEYVKSIIAKTPSIVFKPEYNILARKIKDQEYIEKDKYRKIIKEVSKDKIDLG